MIQDILEKRIKQLPPLPDSVAQIERIYQDPDASFNDMVKIIEKDPLLTADILKAANSPLYGFSREIKNLSQAVSLFGMGTVRGFVLAGIVKKSFDLDLSPYRLSAEQFSELSSKQHALITNWCMKTDRGLLDVLSPAAFLVEIGKVLLSQCLISEKHDAAFKEKVGRDPDVEGIENEYCGTTTAQISAAIFQHWRFEKALIETISHCEHPDEADAHTRKAAQILHAVRIAVPLNGKITEESAAAARELVERYGLEMESFNASLENVME